MNSPCHMNSNKRQRTMRKGGDHDEHNECRASGVA